MGWSYKKNVKKKVKFKVFKNEANKNLNQMLTQPIWLNQITKYSGSGSLGAIHSSGFNSIFKALARIKAQCQLISAPSIANSAPQEILRTEPLPWHILLAGGWRALNSPEAIQQAYFVCVCATKRVWRSCP